MKRAQIVSLRLPARHNCSPSQRDLRVARAMDRTDGRALAFAASTHESTGEEWVPPGAPLRAGQLHGVFTFHFAAALKRAEQPTLNDLQRIVREGYARERRAEPSRAEPSRAEPSRAEPPPQFSGAPGMRLP